MFRPSMHLAPLDLAALLVALASVLSKEILFGVTHAIGLRCRSAAIVAYSVPSRRSASISRW